MKNQRPSTLVSLIATAAIFSAGMLQAAPPVYEPFDYPAGNLHGASGTSEVGLSGAWDAKVENPNSTAVAAGSLAGLYQSSGGKVGPLSGGVNKYGGSRALQPAALAGSGLLSDGATLWLSVVMGYGPGGNVTNSRLALALANDNFSAGNFDYWIKDAGSQSGEGVGVVLGRFSTNGRVLPVKFRNLAAGDGTAGNINGVWSGTGTSLTTNQHALYVVKFTWGATPSAPDSIEVYQPDASLALGSPISTLANIFVNQAAFDTLTFARGDVVVLDEIRIAASYAGLELSQVGDTDFDGMDDAWETANFGNLSHDGTADTDDDLLIDSLEFTLDLNPNAADSDADGHPDWMGIPGYLYLERWNDISGGNLADLFASAAFHGQPNDVYLVTQAKAPGNAGDNYGLRMSGRVIAPATGQYHFWIAGDGQCDLYLSSDSTAFKRRRVASVNVGSGEEQWDLGASQKSVAIDLVAGQEYYLEVLMKESTGADHVAVAWDFPGQSRQIIPGANLRSYITDPADADGDGMLDTWETSVGLNPNDNGSTNYNQSGYADIDGDGLLNFEEYNYGGNPFVVGANQGYLELDVWHEITGAAVKDLIGNAKYAAAPDLRTLSPADLSGLGSNYGARLRGTITAPQTGDYTFTIAGDEQTELWISSTDNPFAKRKIAYSIIKTNYQQWLTGTRQSAGIHLEQGKSYYIEALVKNGVGPDHLSIGWSRIAESEWQIADIGSGTTSTWSVNSGTGTVHGSTTGGDIRYASDNFTFRYVMLQGDCEMVARVPSLLSSNASAKAGLMIRESLAAASTHALMLLTKNGGINLHHRATTGAQTVNGGGLAAGQPYQWLRITRTGNVLTGYHSLDGLTWKQKGTCTIAMGQSVYVGMATASTATGVAVAADWDHIGFTDVSRAALIPSSALASFSPSPLDLDDDNLPGAWETAMGLNASTAANGMGQYGDPDGDHVSNYDEYLLGSDPLSNGGIAGNLTRELWSGLHDDTIREVVTATSFLQGSAQIELLPASEQLTLGNTSGTQRVRGTITAPVTGDYRFWISGYSDCELWLSDSGASKFGKRKLAWLNEHDPGGSYLVGFRGWDSYASQRSESIHLEAGHQYFIEVLQKHSQGSGHFSVAWSYTDDATGQLTARGLIPAAQLASLAPDPDDEDDDYLPDSWETAMGLAPTDNGLTDRTREGEYGDHDGDFLTNREEWLLGTNPTNDDTDGDGWSDFDEYYIYATDPLISNQVSFVAIAMPPPGQYASATGGWTLNANGSLSAWDRRGEITYTFTLAEPGVHEIKLTGAAIGTLRTVENLPIVFSIDGNLPFSTTSLVSINGGVGTAKAVTPWLTAGTHTLTILHDNYRAARRLRIDSIEVNRLGGEDLDEDGVPDWVMEDALAANALTNVLTQSRTSPLCVEGHTQSLSSATLSALMPGAQQADPVPLTSSINDTFFADVPLSAEGTVTLDASFLGGFITESKTVTWIATNLFDTFADNSLHIRVNDSLRLDAWTGTADGQPFTVTLDGNLLADGSQNTTHTSGQPFAATFATAGTFTLIATHGGQSATVTLRVHAADFGPEFIVRALQPRSWTPPLLDALQLVGADQRVSLYETTVDPQTVPRSFSVSVNEGANRQIISRLPGNVDGAPSAIVACGTIHGFYLAHADETGDARIIGRYPDGTWLMSSSLVAVNLPHNVMIQITSTQQGTLFTNGNNVLVLHASDFDANGTAMVYFEWSGTGAPKLCHKTRTFIEP